MATRHESPPPDATFCFLSSSNLGSFGVRCQEQRQTRGTEFPQIVAGYGGVCARQGETGPPDWESLIERRHTRSKLSDIGVMQSGRRERGPDCVLGCVVVSPRLSRARGISALGLLGARAGGTTFRVPVACGIVGGRWAGGQRVGRGAGAAAATNTSDSKQSSRSFPHGAIRHAGRNVPASR